MFEEVFKFELRNLGIDNTIAAELWDEIQLNYAGPGRYYHNLIHLDRLVGQLLPVKVEIEDFQTLVFSIAYHDIVYDTTRNDNEEQSAAFALERLIYLEQLPERKEKCREQILATKGHQVSENPDTNYFTDADLSILGADRDEYSIYAQQIRKEYGLYTDAVYRAGRTNVLNYFLSMNQIFKTDYFKEKFEVNAKINIKNELRSFS